MAFNTYAPTIYQKFTYVLAAGADIDVSVYGRFLTVLSNSNATDPHISVGGQAEYQIPAGLSIDLNPSADSGAIQATNFGKLRFRNSSGSSMTIEFAISSGRIIDNRVTISTSTILSVNNTGQTMSTPAAYAVATAAPGAAFLAAASTTREVIMQNNGAAPVWIGDANVDGSANRGILIPVGGTFALQTAAALYARSTGAASTLSYMVIAT